MEWLDGGDLLQEKPKPIDWFLEDLLPLGTIGDVFSPPGSGKSTILTTLMLVVAAGQGRWFGKTCVGGPVLVLGGEKSSRDVWVRDLHRAAGSEVFEIDPGRLLIAPPALGPLFRWNPREGKWQEGQGYDGAMRRASDLKPALTIIDTSGRAASGQDPISISQQQALAERIEDLGREVGGTLLTVSHTSQASGSEDLHQRLHYISRAGSNGIPGHFRWLMGMTLLNPKEVTSLTGILEDDGSRRQIIAIAISKHNEMPKPRGWNRHDPAVFEILPDGSVVAIAKKPWEPQQEPPQKRQRTKRGLGNLVGVGADEFDKKLSSAPPSEDEDLSWLK
ncbi:MAG: AAA family ATPase [Acidiferrobacter thiooxydans]